MARIAIIGGGNIGEALLAGLLQSGRQVKDLVVAEAYPARAAQLADKYSVRVTDVSDAAENAAYVIVAVKPDAVEGVVEALAVVAADADSSSVEQVVVSVAAGVPTSFYEAKLPAGAPVVRAMPNTPMLVGAGITALSRGRFANEAQLAEVADIFSAVGAVLTVPEKQMDAVTAVSGSGPAYFLLMVEAVVDAGVAAGLPRAVATELAAQTMAGSAAMLLNRMAESGTASAVGPLDTSAAQLRASVTSPGGTTAAGLRELERGGLRAAVASAVEAAKTRSEQLRITSE
ncbi:pyrroline-5-carboxylate reductase [Mycolicibacterium sp. HS_4_1]